MSEHFNEATEFLCKCGHCNTNIKSKYLVNRLEQLRHILGDKPVTITSGARCPSWSVKQGGYATDAHVVGIAADITVKDTDALTIAQAAEKVGFGGIGIISSTAVHVDCRDVEAYYNSSGQRLTHWFGDEHGTYKWGKGVNLDYIPTFGTDRLPKEEVKPTTNKAIMNGVDVSEHQGNIDWSKVKTDFVILRAGYGRELSQKDKKFEQNYVGAKSAGIPVGIYWYSYADSAEAAKKEAEVCLEVIKGKQFEFPIFFDLEESKQLKKGREFCDAITVAFCDVLEKAGYWAGLYMSRSPLQTCISTELTQRYALWVAEYASKLNWNGAVGMWQKSSTGKFNGVNGNVDVNECYVDYPSLIKSAKLNGFKDEEKPTAISEPKDESIAPSTIIDSIKKLEITVDGEVVYSANIIDTNNT